MYIIVGLGNPGAKYSGTRHNIGFDIISEFAEKNNINFNKQSFLGLIGEGYIEDKKVLLVMPQTYMNLSGECVLKVIEWYKESLDNLIVIYDDISLEVGKIRIRKKGSHGGHNGMKNIISKINSSEFTRIRVGIGDKPENWDLADHVLSKFSDDENKILINTTDKVCDALDIIIKKDIDSAMNIYN